jgi:hypothetical protein
MNPYEPPAISAEGHGSKRAADYSFRFSGQIQTEHVAKFIPNRFGAKIFETAVWITAGISLLGMGLTMVVSFVPASNRNGQVAISFIGLGAIGSLLGLAGYFLLPAVRARRWIKKDPNLLRVLNGTLDLSGIHGHEGQIGYWTHWRQMISPQATHDEFVFRRTLNPFDLLVIPKQFFESWSFFAIKELVHNCNHETDRPWETATVAELSHLAFGLSGNPTIDAIEFRGQTLCPSDPFIQIRGPAAWLLLPILFMFIFLLPLIWWALALGVIATAIESILIYREIRTKQRPVWAMQWGWLDRDRILVGNNGTALLLPVSMVAIQSVDANYITILIPGGSAILHREHLSQGGFEKAKMLLER